MGRPRKPTETKKLAGTHKKSRDNPLAPTPPAVKPEPPAYLTELQREHFAIILERLEAEKRAYASHTELIALAAINIATLIECEALIKQYGRIMVERTDRGQEVKRANPAVAMHAKALAQLHRALTDLGLTPAAVSKMASLQDSKPNREANEFDEFT